VADGTSFTRVFRKGQVLFAKRRAYQRKVAVADFDGICSSDILVFEPKGDELIPELLPFIVQSDGFFEHALGTSAGSLSPRTRWSQLKEYEFPLPPRAEQRCIADILWAAEEAKSNYSRAEQGMIGLARAVAAKQFPSLNRPQVRFVKLGDICVRQPQSGLYKGPDFLGRGTRTVNMDELFGNDVIEQSVPMKRMHLSPEEVANYSLTPDDLLFGRRSIVLEGAGKCSMVGRLDEPTVFESSILRVTIDSAKASSHFIFWWFNSPEGAREIRRVRRFTTVAGISGADLKKVRVPLLPLAEQREIVKVLGELAEKRKMVAAQLQKMHTLASGIREQLIGYMR